VTAALLRGRELIGRPVVDGSTGDDIAEVKDVVFDAARGEITGLTLRRRGFLGRRLKEVLPVGEITSIGTDAVMIENADALTSPDDAPADMSTNRKSNVLANEVITESGRTLGTVRDVIVLGGRTPRVVGFEVGGGPVGDGLVPVGRHSAVSGSSLIVPDGYEGRIRSDLTGLAGELASLDEERR
jgi:uncharacterized protein YrrD